MRLLRNTSIIRTAGLVAGFLLLAILFVRLGPGRIVSLLTSLGWNFPIIVCLFAAHELVRTLAITHWLPADRRPPVAELLRIRLFGEGAGALTRTGSLAAEPTRAWLLATQGGQGASGYSAAAGELLANSATSAAVNAAVAGVLLWTGAVKGPLGILAQVLLWSSLVYLAAVVGIVGSRVRLFAACGRVLARLPFVGRRIQVNPARVQEMERAVGTLTERPIALARVVALELAAQTFLVCEVYWAIRSMGIAVPFRSALTMEVMTRAFTVVEFVGATEMGFAFVFTWIGLPAAIGFTLSLIKTLRSLSAAGIAIGLAGATHSRPVLTAAPRVHSAVMIQEVE